MLTPARALRGTESRPPLPRVEVLSSLYGAGVVPRKSQILMIAGQPGSLKSMFGQWYADSLGVPVLYFCADSDQHTAISRLVAKRSGIAVSDVAAALETGYGSSLLGHLQGSQVQFCFDSGPTLQDMADEIAAYVELHDAFPDVILIDNLLNVEAETGEDMAGMRRIAKEVHRIARETGAAVIILHHMRETGSPLFPQPRADISGKVAQLPEVILSVAHDETERCFKVNVSKNRSGPQDPTGRMFHRFSADPARATFGPWMGTNNYGGS